MTLPIETPPIPTRDDLRDLHLRLRLLKNPEIDISEGGEPWHSASVAADVRLPVYSALRRLSRAMFFSAAEGDDVDYWGEIEGVARPIGSTALGVVEIVAATSGGIIKAGDQLRIKGRSGGPRFEARMTGTYYSREYVPVQCLDAGSEGNLPAGTVLEWTATPAGIGPYATVVARDGDGLTGGAPGATDATYKATIATTKRLSPGGTNPGAVIRAALSAPLPAAAAFAYPTMIGPGSIGLAFVTFPTGLTRSRLPSDVQLRVMIETLEQAFGATDSVIVMPVLAQPLKVSFGLQLSSGWGNATTQWPPKRTVGVDAWKVTAVDSSGTVLTVAAEDASVTEPPVVGSVFSAYDAGRGLFVRLVAGDVSVGGSSATVTLDTRFGASDLSYRVQAGQLLSTWSESHNEVASRIRAVFDSLGPGEVVTSYASDGERRKRFPYAEDQSPYRITQALMEGALDGAPGVVDRELLSGDGHTVGVGRPGLFVYLPTLGDLALYRK